MTNAEIFKTFKVMMDKNAEAVAYGGCPAFLDTEVDLFLNQAYVEIVCNKYTGTNVLKTPFEGSVKRIQDLEQLVKTDKSIKISLETGSNVISVSNLLDVTFDSTTDSNVTGEGENKKMFFVSAVLHWNKVEGDITTDPRSATVIMIDHNTADRFLYTYNNMPWIPTPVAIIADNTLKIYVDPNLINRSFTIDITYVKYPDKIDHSKPTVEITEVPDRVLYEVINRAVIIALENIESKRTETKINLNNLQE